MSGVSATRNPKTAKQPRRGNVGDRLASAEIVETKSGRLTTPFPAFSTISRNNAARLVRNARLWLFENAALEAESRGDRLSARLFRLELDSKDPGNPDLAEEYLFGAPHAPLPPPFLKSMTAPEASELQLDFQGQRMPVQSIGHAQRLWIRYRDGSGRSEADLAGGIKLYRGPTLVASVSYNGRVWSPTGVELPFGDGGTRRQGATAEGAALSPG